MRLDLQLRAKLPDRRRYRHETIMSCLVIQDDPCLSFTARSCLSQAAHREAVRRCSVGQLVREEAVEVRLSPAGPAPTDRSPGPRLRVDVGEARPSFSLGRPGSRRLSQPLLVWVGPLREPVELCGPPPQGDLREGRVLTVGPAQRGQDGPWGTLWGPGIFRRPSAPRQLGAGFRGTRWAGLSTCRSSLLESQCPRGGGVAWAGVPAASATASEEPWMLAL